MSRFFKYEPDFSASSICNTCHENHVTNNNILTSSKCKGPTSASLFVLYYRDDPACSAWVPCSWEFGQITMKFSMHSQTLLDFTEERQKEKHSTSSLRPGFETSAYHQGEDRCSGKEPKVQTTLFLYVNSGISKDGRKWLGDILVSECRTDDISGHRHRRI